MSIWGEIMNIKETIKKNLKLYLIMTVIIVLGTVGITLAATSKTFNPVAINTSAGTLDAIIDYTGLSNTSVITSTNEMLPIDDSIVEATGINIDDSRVLKAEFNVTGVDTNPANTIYDVVLYGDSIDCDLRTTDVKWRLYKNNTLLSNGNLSPTFDIMKNNRLVLTNVQQSLTTNTDKYTFILWISESCTGDISQCDASLDQSKYLNKTLNASLKVELSAKSTKTLVRTTSTKLVCKNGDKFVINYDANGGIGAPENQEKNYGESIILSDITPTREGYTFVGWSASPYTTSATYGPGSTFAVNANTTLFAVWDGTYLKNASVDGLSESYRCNPSTTDCNLTFLGSTIKRDKISSVTFVDNISAPEGITPIDVSEKNNGTIMMWYSQNTNGKYDITIGSSTGKTLIKNGQSLFSNLNNATTINFNNAVDTSNMTSMYGMFNYCLNLISIDFSGVVTQNVTDMTGMFSNCRKLTNLDLSNWAPIRVTSMTAMFQNCNALTSIGDVRDWNTGNVTSMLAMFGGCTSLTILDLSGWDTKNVTTMQGMFQLCEQLTTIGNISKWNTSKVTTMYGMFMSCINLTSLDSDSNLILDLSGWDTSNVIDMSAMFQLCSNITSIGDTSKWNTSSVLKMQSMFVGCENLTSLNVSTWNTSNVTIINDMFSGCSNLTTLDLSGWDTSNVTNMYGMFYNCSKLTTIYVGNNWSTNKVTTSSLMFNNCTSLKGGAGTVYDGNNIDATYAKIDGGTASPGYFTEKIVNA